MNILGGVALLLWGTQMVQSGITRAYGSTLRHWIGVGMRNPLSSLGVGVGVTVLLQSSTATALLMTSFASRGIIETAPALAVLLGADVGTTLVVQLLTFDLSWLAPLLLVLGVVLYRNAREVEHQEVGRAAIGLGLMLLALALIVRTAQPLQHGGVLSTVLPELQNDLLILVLIGALLAWLAHSSLATVLLVTSLVSSQVITPYVAFALVLGINVGGVLPALVATMGKSPAARRLPLGNLFFKCCGVLALMPFLHELAALADTLQYSEAREVALFHTGFNAMLAVLFLFVTPAVARLMARALPDDPSANNRAEPHFLDPAAIKTPDLATALAERETLRMGEIVDEMLRRSLDVFRSDNRRQMEDIEGQDDLVDELNEAIKLYLTKVSREAMSQKNSQRIINIITFATNLEHIGDIIDKNLMELAAKKMRHHLHFSEEGMQDILSLHTRLQEHLALSLTVFMTREKELARRLLMAKRHFAALEREAAERHLARLRRGTMESIDTSSIHLDILRDLKRINSHVTSVVYPILDEAGEPASPSERDADRLPDRGTRPPGRSGS